MRNIINLLNRIYPGFLAKIFVFVCFSSSPGQDFSNGKIDFIFRLGSFETYQQFVIWVENGNGEYVGTVSLTDFIGRRGGGNRTSDPNIDAEYGNRLSALPTWSFKRNIIDITYGIENYYPPNELQSSYPEDIDAVTRATPYPGIQRKTWQLYNLPSGTYTCCIEVNRDYDFNQYHNYSWYRGQPSVVWNTTINVSDNPDSNMVLNYTGYGSPDGSNGNINMPDITITTAADLLSDLGGFRFKVVYRPEVKDDYNDSLALVALYESTDGANWTNNTNWLTGQPVVNWYGITVSENRVIAIQLDQNNLIGTIPDELGSLTELTRLNLRNNQISGEIPAKIGNLNKLTQLFLENNMLTGTIPIEIENLSNLEQLDLHFNNLSGTIPPGIFNMTNLTTLILFGNELSGTLSKEIGNLVNLQSLELYSNLLSGEIPTEIGSLTKLTRLFLALNQFTGAIPASIGNLINLTNLQLNGNQLTGIIPPEIGNLTELRTLLFYHNQLDGSILPEIGNLTNLTQLNLSSNQLSDSIPVEMGNLINMRSLELNNNQLTGAIPAEFGSFNELDYLALHSNMLEELPDLSAISTLNEIRIYNNKFTFEDIEPNITIPTILYSPQDSIGTQQDTTIKENEKLTLSVSVGGTANQYQWIKDGGDIPNANSSTYIIESIVPPDSGSYLCRITNTIVTELTLYSRPVNVKVSSEAGFSDKTVQIYKTFELLQNFPNPFNPITTIQFQVPQTCDVSLKIYNILGELVATLISKRLTAGKYTFEWDASNMASGLYLYRLEAGDPSQGVPKGQFPTGQAGQGFIETKKTIIMR